MYRLLTSCLNFIEGKTKYLLSEPQVGNLLTLFVESIINYFSNVIDQSASPNCSQTQPATDNGAIDSISK